MGGVIKRDLNAKVTKAAPEVAAAAQKLFQAIRTADYNHDWISTKDWEQFPAKDVDYCVDHHNYPGWVRWVCRKFKANPITDVRLGQVFTALDGSPAVHFELRLKDGEVLQGDLPFHWYADEAMDRLDDWTGTCTRRLEKGASRSRQLDMLGWHSTCWGGTRHVGVALDMLGWQLYCHPLFAANPGRKYNCRPNDRG